MVNLSFEYRSYFGRFHYEVGDHLNFAIPRGKSEKFYLYSRGSLKIYKTWKKAPLPVKKMTLP